MKTYSIVRFCINRSPRIMHKGLSLEEAQAHCSLESTHKKANDGSVIWFDGYHEE